jgi:hypothetical protein
MFPSDFSRHIIAFINCFSFLSYGCATLAWLLTTQESSSSSSSGDDGSYIWDSSWDRCSTIGGFVAAWLTCSTGSFAPNPSHSFYSVIGSAADSFIDITDASSWGCVRRPSQ